MNEQSEIQNLPLAPVEDRALAARRVAVNPEILQGDVYPREADGGGHGAAPSMKLGMLLRYKWMMLGIFLLVAGAGLPAVWFLFEPVYEATATVEVRPFIPILVYKTEESGAIPLYQQYLAAQISYMRSSRILERVLAQPKVSATKWYRGNPDSLVQRIFPPGPPLERLNEALTIDTPKSSQIINVSMKCAIPGEAQIIVEALIKEYLVFAQDMAEGEEEEKLRMLRTTKFDFANSANTLKKEVGELSKKLGSATPAEIITQRRVRFEQAAAAIALLDLRLKTYAKRLADLTEGAAATSQPTGTGADQQSRFEGDAEWRQLQTAVRTAEQHLKATAQRFGESHYKYVEASQAVEHARESLAMRESQLSRTADAVVTGSNKTQELQTEAAFESDPAVVRQKMDAMTAQRDVMESALHEEKVQLDQTFDLAQDLESKIARLTEVNEKLADVTKRLDVKELERQVPATIRQLSPAFERSGAVNSKKRYQALAGVLFGAVALAGGAAFMRVRMSSAIHHADDLAAPVRGAILGIVPLQRSTTVERLYECGITGDSIRLIRTSLLNRLAGNPGQVVQITSAGPGAGKSTMATLLSRSLAQAGKRVLLVDADVHRPTLGRLFRLEGGPGLIEALTDQAPEESAVRKTDTPNLSILPVGGRIGADDVELLANGVFTRLLDKWRDRFDLVLVDSAPLLAAADAAMIAQRADATILVVREKHCRRRDLAHAMRLLAATGGTLIGTVFLGARGRRTEGYGYRYGYAASEQRAGDDAGNWR